MKSAFLFLMIIFSLICYSQTHIDLNNDASDNYKKADLELNEVYQQILNEYKNDTALIKHLKKSQRIWIAFRDAELEMKFPLNNKQVEYGSNYAMCVSEYLTELTCERTEKLKVWIVGSDEGDECNGSVRIISSIDSNYMSKAYIDKDSIIWLTANMRLDHRIFGYQKNDITSKKMIILSIFTSEVENNPFNCSYGAYYDTNEMDGMQLRYNSHDGHFLKIAIIKDNKELDTVYMEKVWFVFE